MARATHVLMLPWKLAVALLPPPELGGGWPLFATALLILGGQVILIEAFANQVGCQWGLSQSVTAITLVALGTSLPDLFASIRAAKDDPTADNSIGNVTGSNSVNVFLGLGLPWLMASLYWAALGPTEAWRDEYPNVYADYVNASTRRFAGGEKGGFVVCAGSLGFTVVVFSACATLMICAILARRFCCSPPAELGGERRLAWATFGAFIALWVVYITISVVRDMELVAAWSDLPGFTPEGQCP